jgi:sugar diacid utilization regulator
MPLNIGGMETVSQAVPAPEAMQELVRFLRERQDELVEEGVRRIYADIPAYGRIRDPAFEADVREHVGLHHTALVESVELGRPIEPEDVSFIRPIAARRVGKVPLSSFMHGFRSYLEVVWEAVLQTAVDDRSKDVALYAFGIVMRYINAAATEAAEAFLEGERLMSLQGERVRRDLMEDLVAGVSPAPGPKLAAARDAGLVAGAPLVLVAAVVLEDHPEDHRLRSAASAIARAGGSAVEPLTVVRQQEILCVAPTAAGQAGLPDALEAAQQRLAAEGIPLAIGVSGVTEDVGGLPDAYAEASAAVERLRPAGGGVLALSSLSAFECLALFGRKAARRRVPPAVARFVAEDRADGGVLITTLREYADADFNVKAASARLFVHPNTARYRLGKIEERTGLDLRRFADVQELLIAVRVEELAD